MSYKIRRVNEADYCKIEKMLLEAQSEGDSYFFQNMSKEELLDYWIKPKFHCFVYEENGEVFASYILGAIAEGRFSHVANASYIVDKNCRGKGIGKKLAEHSIEFAKANKFYAMQFLRVVSTNKKAVEAWKKLGFEIIGTVPNAFNHKDLGFVDSYIFYKKLA